MDRPSSPAGAPSGMPRHLDGVALPDVPSYMLWAILSSLFCCMPTGIVAIVYAAQVQAALNANDGEGALRASRRALWWSLGGPIALLVSLVVAGAVEVVTRLLGP